MVTSELSSGRHDRDRRFYKGHSLMLVKRGFLNTSFTSFSFHLCASVFVASPALAGTSGTSYCAHCELE